MTKIKAVNFRPSRIDDALITKLKEEKDIEATADVIRAALQHYASVSLDPAVYANTILGAYEQEVSGH